MNIRLAAKLDEDSILDGEGIRLVLWFQGCPRRCPGCHNPETLSKDGGKVFDIDEVLQEILKHNNKNITFTGGDPFLQIDELIYLSKRLKEENFNIWCYTGYTYEELQKNNKFKEALKYIDVLVDGPFIQEKKSLEVPFRGSTNQRLIDLKKTLKEDKIIPYNLSKKSKRKEKDIYI